MSCGVTVTTILNSEPHRFYTTTLVFNIETFKFEKKVKTGLKTGN